MRPLRTLGSGLPRVALGAVLCGGASRRMGADKALLFLDGKSLLVRASAVLTELGAPVVLCCGARERYLDLGLELVLDRGPGLGPLAGLEAALARAARPAQGLRDGYVCVLACDMPQADVRVFEGLLLRAQERGADACLFATADGLEPLLAVYSTRCLGAVRRALDAGGRRMDAFHHGFAEDSGGDSGELVIERLEAHDLPAETSLEVARNLNTPAELKAAGGLSR